MTAEDDRRDENARFWTARGSERHATDPSLTFLAEHAAYTAYIHEVEMTRIAPFVPAASRILDAGCGVGRVALALARNALEVTGFDLSPSFIERARAEAERMRVANVRFDVGGIDDDWPDGPFDLVVLSGVLNYVGDETMRRVLRRATASLRSGGAVYLRNACANVARHESSGTADRAPTIYRTQEEYRAATRGAGLTVELDDYLFAPLCWPNLAYYHVLPRKLRDGHAVSDVLARWFELERATSPARLALLGKAYPALLRLLHKPTSFRIIVARKS